MSPTSEPSPQASRPSPAVDWPDAQRKALFDTWLSSVGARYGLHPHTVAPASADASFRRYLRVQSDHGSRIIMDAPPDKENCQPFVHVAALMRSAGLRVPDILDWDQAHGFMLLSDLGQHTMMQVIDPAAPPPLSLYMQAVDSLIRWQLASRPGELPEYNQALLRREMELFPQWYLGEHRHVTVDATLRKTLDSSFAAIEQNNLAWAQVYVHRDFMPRNLMVAEPGSGSTDLGVLDFQDAVFGPITYDIASLMRDAFLSWDEEFCLDVTIRYWQKARKAGLPVGDDFGEFYRGVEWMGLQRHLKVAGIFARLTLRDGKPKYLQDTPRFIAYLYATCNRYMELKPLLRLIEQVEGIELPSVYAFGRS